MLFSIVRITMGTNKELLGMHTIALANNYADIQHFIDISSSSTLYVVYL